MVKKTEKKKEYTNTDNKKGSSTQAKKSEAVERVEAEKVEKKTLKKPTPKYHFSVNLTPKKREAAEDAVHEAETEKKPFGSKEAKKTQEEKKQPTQTHLTKEAAAVHAAETPDKKDVKHIKYSEQKKSNIAAPSKPTSVAKKCCGGGTCSSAKISPKVEELKKPINALRSDPKAFRQLQNFVKPSLLTTTKNALAKRVSLKYWNNTLIGIMKGTDAFISFITMPRDEGRNQAIQKARSPVLFGLWVLFIFFIIGGFWAGFAPLDKAVGAQGFIVTSSKKQVIQHKEGGILDSLYVKEGDHVKIDQSLAKLSDAQATESLKASIAQKEGAEKNLKIAQEQLKIIKELAEKGFYPRLKVIQQEATENEYKAKLDSANAEIAIREEALGRLILKSPVNGIVTQINVTTIGGTIGQGAPIMTITPSQEDLILEAYVQAKDIEPVHVGMKAKVMVSAFRSKTTADMEGIVTYISPDLVDLVQQPGGRTSPEAFVLQKGMYYKVRVSIDKRQLKKISKFKDYELVPGMDASIQFKVGERTLLQYLLDPILMSFWHAFKEK